MASPYLERPTRSLKEVLRERGTGAGVVFLDEQRLARRGPMATLWPPRKVRPGEFTLLTLPRILVG